MSSKVYAQSFDKSADYSGEPRKTPDELATFERNVNVTTITYRDSGATHEEALQRARDVLSRGNVQSVSTIRVRTMTVKQTQTSY